MDPVTYKVKSLQGGDAENDAGSDEKQERKDFRPTALFEPEIITDGKSYKHNYNALNNTDDRNCNIYN